MIQYKTIIISLLREISKLIDNMKKGIPLGYKASVEVESSLVGFCDKKLITEIDDEAVTEINGHSTFQDWTNLTKVSFTKLKIIDGYQTFYGCTNLETLNLPELEVLSNGGLGHNNNSFRFYGCPKLKEISMPKVTSMIGDRVFECYTGVCTLERISVPNLSHFEGSAWFYNFADDLIDVEVGKNLTLSFPYLRNWTATNALKTDSSSLVKEGEPFANNREKLLYNIRHHIADLLPNRMGIGTLTIYFHANIKEVINNDTELLNAFVSKNWTIA